ncbi:MAG: hypothetical protein OXD45_10210 [Rhodobacteraceae bacterium]|nr:hypothetical protein [Paracoccaceae bacterium]
MGRWIKWILVLVIASQIGMYFWTKNSIPQQVVSLIEEKGCGRYEVFGMDLPLAYFFSSETETVVYLFHPTDSNLVGIHLKVTLMDTSAPFLKGWTNGRFWIEGTEIGEYFAHCWK